MNNRILIITGGTGGHVIPAVNFFNYISSKSDKVFLLTDNRGFKYTKNINQNKIFKIYSSHMSGGFFFQIISINKVVNRFCSVNKNFFKI